MTETPANENELVSGAKDGDRDAFDALVRACAGGIYNLALQLSGNASSAEDIAQEAFIRAYKSIKSFEHKSTFSSWVHRIAVNVWKNRVRYEKRRLYFKHDSLDEMLESDDGETLRQIPGGDPAPQMFLEKEQEGGSVRQALNALGDEAKTMIVLRDIEGLSYEEIAEISGTPLGTVKSRIARAREALKNEFKKYGENNG